MECEIKIDLLDVDVKSLVLDMSSPPSGITVRGPIATTLCSENAPLVPMFIILNIALPIATNLVASYIFTHLSKHKGKRIRIDREEIRLERGEIERVIREKIDIQQ